MASTMSDTVKKRKRVEEDETLFNDNELDAIKSLITYKSVIALREVHVVEKLSNTGNKQHQYIKSRSVSVVIPNRSAGLQILNGIGTVTKSTSKTTYISLSNINEIRLCLPEFPKIIKKGAYNGTYLHIRCGVDRLLFAFADSIVDKAMIKITQDHFTIEFKSRHVDSAEAGIPFDGDIHLQHLSAEDYWDELEINDDAIQRYRLGTTTDINTHRGIWFD